MNANETSPKVNPRLDKIKTICRSLKIMVLLYCGCFGIFLPFVNKTPVDGYWRVFNGTYATFAEVPLLAKLLALLGIGIFAVAIITSYQLLNLYEKGIIFAGTNVRLLRRLGLLSAAYGMLAILGGTLISTWNHWIGVATGNLLNYFIFDFFAMLASPWVIGGMCMIVLSHIMDEGRKIQEEQELTV